MRTLPEGWSVETYLHIDESIESQRERYPLALASVFDYESMNLGTSCQPPELRRCVFDSADGVRLVVCLEERAGWGEYLHLSASLEDGCKMYREIKSGHFTEAGFVLLALSRFEEISGDRGMLRYVWTSPGKVFHWIRKLGKDR